MRGVIMSVEGSKAVLLTQGGDFKQIRNKNYNIGDKVKVRTNYAARIGSIAAALAVFAIGGGASYFMPASYVSVDINPSFLMTLNIYDKVINIEPLNGEAQTVLKHTDIKGKNINDTVETLINESRQKGYINDNGGEVIVSVVPGIKTPKIEDKNTSDNINLVIGEADKTEYDEAKDMGVSIAKAKAIEEYTNEFGGTVSSNADKLSGMTVKQIKTEIEDKKEPDVTPAPAAVQSIQSPANSNPSAQSAPQPAAKAAPAQSFNAPQLFSSEPSNGSANGNNAAEQKHEDNRAEVKQDNPQPKNNNENTNSQNITEEPRRLETPNTSASMKPDEAPSEAKQSGGMPTGNSQGEPAKKGNELPEPKQENNAPDSNPQQMSESNNDAPKDNTPTNNNQQGGAQNNAEPSGRNVPQNNGGNASTQTAPNGGGSNAPSNNGGGNAPSNNNGSAPAGGSGGGSQGGGPSGGGNGGGPR